MFNFHKKEPEPDQYTDEQAVIVEIDLSHSDTSKDKELTKLKALESGVQQALPRNTEWDGDDITTDEATFYIYGPDADAVFSSIKDVLKKSDFDYITITLRYGALDTKSEEKKFTL